MRDHGATIASEGARAAREARDRRIRERSRRGEPVKDIARAERVSLMTVRRALGTVRMGS